MPSTRITSTRCPGLDFWYWEIFSKDRKVLAEFLKTLIQIYGPDSYWPDRKEVYFHDRGKNGVDVGMPDPLQNIVKTYNIGWSKISHSTTHGKTVFLNGFTNDPQIAMWIQLKSGSWP